MSKCKCGIGDMFWSHLHAQDCPCFTDPSMVAPQDPKDKRIEELTKRVAELERALALAEGADTCETCGRIIAPDEERHNWLDGVTTCIKCGGPPSEK